jgi:hypothetical protein
MIGISDMLKNCPELILREELSKKLVKIFRKRMKNIIRSRFIVLSKNFFFKIKDMKRNEVYKVKLDAASPVSPDAVHIGLTATPRIVIGGKKGYEYSMVQGRRMAIWPRAK